MRWYHMKNAIYTHTNYLSRRHVLLYEFEQDHLILTEEAGSLHNTEFITAKQLPDNWVVA